jgi:hypothetical protein
VLTVVLGAPFAFVPPAAAHCDTLDGSVVVDAKLALAAGEVTPVLKWVRAEDEPQIRTAFDKTLAARQQGEAARDVADTWFFETLVRVHRAGEGAPFDGLKPAGAVEPGIAAADRALATGSAKDLVDDLTAALAAGVRKRFGETFAAREHAGESIAAGRGYVAAYVEFIHFVEGIHTALAAAEDHPKEHPAPAAHRH